MQWPVTPAVRALHVLPISCVLTSCQAAHEEVDRKAVLRDIEPAHMKPATIKLTPYLTVISSMGH